MSITKLPRLEPPSDHVPLPPPDAVVLTTACDYCIVACGYKVFVWPEGEEGGPRADENALGADYPVAPMSGRWISPGQHTMVMRDGRRHHAVVIPDYDADVVNRGGNGSIRGGTLAQKCYRADGSTRDRLKHPLLRVGGELRPISWDDAMAIMAGVSRHVLERHGEHAWGMKAYSYGYFENTYAISKLAFVAVKTPAFSEHDKPGPGNDTAGMDDAGINTFSMSYQDMEDASVIFVSGTDPYETKTVLFTEWMMKGGAKLVMALPRRTMGVEYAERNGGLFLQLLPGTDTVLHMALARIILENGWQDQEWIDRWIANSWEIDSGFGRGTRNTPWQWRTTWGRIGSVGFAAFKEWLFAQPESQPERAAEITGLPLEKIRQAAELVARPVGGVRPKTSFVFEKGNYWSNNYLNTASFANLGLICGAGNRPGRVISRLGGHQRGWMGAAGYPIALSPNKLQGRRRQEIDLDRWVESGNLRFAWVIGTTWTGAMAASSALERRFRELTSGNAHQVERTDREHAIARLRERVDSGGMVVVDQDIYRVEPMGTEIADLVLPASGWGEQDLTRCNGERRLRLYAKFYDAPGEAKPDWWIVARFAREMGYDGFDWENSNEVFEESARFGRTGVLNYHPLVTWAKQHGRPAHEVVRELGTTGIQTPVRLAGGRLVGTPRLHDPDNAIGTPAGPTVHQGWLAAFDTHSGKAELHKTPWSLFADFYEAIQPREGELWVTGGRINELWQSSYDDRRKPTIVRRWPDPGVAEIHPEDARRAGIESGDLVALESDEVFVQTGGFVEGDSDSISSFTKLREAGHIRTERARCEAVAIVTDAVRPGLVFTNFLHSGSPANSLVNRVPDPITLRYRFKLARARISKIGESPLKTTFEAMTFAPRAVWAPGSGRRT